MVQETAQSPIRQHPHPFPSPQGGGGGVGHAPAPVGVPIRAGARTGSPRLIVSTTSMPSITLPHTVYWRSRKRASEKQMKNCEFAECGKLVRAIEQVPRTCGSALNSALRSGSSEPPEPVPVGSPVWAMKPSMTRWNGTPS